MFLFVCAKYAQALDSLNIKVSVCQVKVTVLLLILSHGMGLSGSNGVGLKLQRAVPTRHMQSGIFELPISAKRKC